MASSGIFCNPLCRLYNPVRIQYSDSERIIVSIATGSDLTVPLLGGRLHFLLRRLHSLTGLVFGGYLVVHLIVNATLIEGTVGGNNIYQLQVDKIHALPFLWAFEWIFIFLPIIYHTFYGIWITLTGQPNVISYGYKKNWFYLLQRISAVIIALFLFFHVLGMKGLLGQGLKFDAAHATESVAAHFHSNAMVLWVVYPIGILASCYHLANGLWTAGITWGVTVSAGAQRRWGYVCAVLFVFTMACGILAMIALVRHDVAIAH